MKKHPFLLQKGRNAQFTKCFQARGDEEQIESFINGATEE